MLNPLFGKITENIRFLLVLSSILLFFLPYSLPKAALTAVTSNSIQGTKPYLKDDYVSRIKNGENTPLLGIGAGSNVYFSDADIKTKLSSSNTKINRISPNELINILSDNETEEPKVALKVLTADDALDDDGDNNFALNSENASAGWFYEKDDGTEEQITDASLLSQTFCELANANISTYLKVVGVLNLKSQYGDPINEVYDKNILNSPIYNTFNPQNSLLRSNGVVCFAQMDMTYSTRINSGLKALS